MIIARETKVDAGAREEHDMIPGLTPSQLVQLHEERCQRLIASSAPFRFHLPILRLARAVAANVGRAIGRVEHTQAQADVHMRIGQTNTPADEVIGLAK
jgi:hypothetical protein